MELFDKVDDTLKALAIDYQLVEHEPALTTEQADQFIEGIEGVRTKTMFLTTRKKNHFYLIIMDDTKRLDMIASRSLLEKSRLKWHQQNACLPRCSCHQELFLLLVF